MKSLCDEIRLRRKKDGFNFICVADFIRATRGFHRAKRDFIEICSSPWYNQFGKLEFVYLFINVNNNGVYMMVTLFNCFSFNDEWYLVEMALTIPPQEIPFSKIVVPEEGLKEMDWQTVLAEQFLNNDGTERICDLYETPDTDDSDSRIAFFIYKTDSHILRTPYGEFELSDAEEVPDRLKEIIEMDEDYM